MSEGGGDLVDVGVFGGNHWEALPLVLHCSEDMIEPAWEWMSAGEQQAWNIYHTMIQENSSGRRFLTLDI